MIAEKHCGACGALIPSGDLFCSVCGKPVPPARTHQAPPVSPSDQPASSGGERTIFESNLGLITDRRLVLHQAQGDKRGSARRDIPLRVISSVEEEVERQIPLSLVFLVGAVALVIQGGAEIVLGLIGLGFAAILFLGSPSVRIKLLDGDTQSFRVRPWRTQEINAFSNALREQLFRNAPNSADDEVTPRWG